MPEKASTLFRRTRKIYTVRKEKGKSRFYVYREYVEMDQDFPEFVPNPDETVLSISPVGRAHSPHKAGTGYVRTGGIGGR